MNIIFRNRTMTGPAPLKGVLASVERLSWRAVGGPWDGRLRVEAGSLEKLWELADLLRCEVRVNDEKGLCWWGFVEGLELHAAGRVVRVSLRDMWNRIAVRYFAPTPTGTGGEEFFTTFAENGGSKRLYGTKEIIFTMGEGDQAKAEAYRAGLLGWHGIPRAQARPAPEAAGDCYAFVELAGWWKTLDWKYYSQGRGQAANLHGGASMAVGSNACQRISQQFVSAVGTWNISEVWVKVRRYMASDNLRVSIYSNNAGSPNVELAYSVIGASSIEDEAGWIRCTLNTVVSVDTGTIRHIVLQRSGSLSDLNYFWATVDEGLHYTGGAMLYYNGAAWGARVPDADLQFMVLGVEDTGTQIKSMLGAGEFVSGVHLNELSGINGMLYRDGSKRIKEEIESLLKVGLSGGSTYLARVCPDRVVQVYRRPSSSEPRYVVDAGGELLDRSGRGVYASEVSAGEWAELGEAGEAGKLRGYDGRVWLSGLVWVDGKLVVEAE